MTVIMKLEKHEKDLHKFVDYIISTYSRYSRLEDEITISIDDINQRDLYKFSSLILVANINEACETDWLCNSNNAKEIMEDFAKVCYTQKGKVEFTEKLMNELVLCSRFYMNRLLQARLMDYDFSE